MIEHRFTKKLRKAHLCGLVVLAAVLGLCFAAFGAVPAFAYDKATAEIPVSVTVSEDSTSVYPDFTVNIAGEDAVSSAALDATSFTVNGAGEGSFSVSASEPVEYTYRVTETAGTAKRWTFDDSIYEVIVQFWNDNTDTLKPQVFVNKIDKDGKKLGMVEGCSFDNVCSTGALTLSDPPVSKRIAGDTPSEKETFTFAFESIDGAPLPENAQDGKVSVTIDGEGTAELGNVIFTKPGTYQYRCYEVTGDAAGYTYDKTVYIATYEVTETVDGLEGKRTITDENGNEVEEIVFTNTYEKPAEPSKATVQANPDTSDTNNGAAIQILVALGICFVGIAALMRFGKRNEK